MTAEQWINHINETEDSQYSSYDCNFRMMERYADYSIQGLLDHIVDFRNKILLNGGLRDFSILAKFDKHFKIEKL